MGCGGGGGGILETPLALEPVEAFVPLEVDVTAACNGSKGNANEEADEADAFRVVRVFLFGGDGGGGAKNQIKILK